MAYTLTEATKLAQTALQANIVETLVGVDPLFSNLPMVPVDGNAIVYNEENALSAADHIAINGTITAATPTYNQRTKAWKMVVSDQSVSELVNAVTSNTVSQYAEAIRRGAKAVAREVMDKLINGDEDSNPEEVDGLFALCADAPYAAQNIEGSATFTRRALSFDILDQLIDKAQLADPMKSAFIMSRRTIRSYKALLRALGGVQGEYVELGTGMQLAYSGIPVFHNDFIGITDDDTSGGLNDEARIYMVSFEETNGMCMFVPSRTIAGIQVENIGKVYNQDNTVIRSKLYYGMAVRGPVHFSFTGGITN